MNRKEPVHVVHEEFFCFNDSCAITVVLNMSL